MLTNSIEITLVASKKVGILPLLMRKLGSLGLIYRRCITGNHSDGVKLTLSCAGTLDCDKSFLIKSLKEIPNVVSVTSVIESVSSPIEVVENLPETFEDTITELHPLRANDALTHDVIHMVENRLSEAFGPVANILLQTALKKSDCVGELFLTLAEDLDEDQKVIFLRNIEGLEQMPSRSMYS